VVAAGEGFGMHPHRDMEIVTIIHSGELTHEDSTGGKGVIHTGEVQRMSAGTGIQHSEFNHGKQPVRLYQIWLLPRQKNLKPGYEQMMIGAIPPDSLKPLASGEGAGGALRISADAAVYQGNVQAGHHVDYPTGPSRHVFVYLTDGSLAVNSVELQPGDQARAKDEQTLKLAAAADSNFILIDTGGR
jgi:redox-sensitive bicupin YhaK (pirin superfamily)